METEIRLKFHPYGLRSYIEVDLCAQCPRQDDKGCCGYYSPVFYPLDFYYLKVHAPHVIDKIWSLPHLTILDHSVTVNSFPDDDGGYYCQFHRREGGCQLPQQCRESICRHFVCPGIDWQSEESLAEWKDYFAGLESLEIRLNQMIAEQLTAKGLSLRHPDQRSAWMAELLRIAADLGVPALVVNDGRQSPQEAIVRRPLKYGTDWPL